MEEENFIDKGDSEDENLKRKASETNKTHQSLFACDKCSQTFTNRMDQNKHAISEHILRKDSIYYQDSFDCDKCTQTFSNKHELKWHFMLKHKFEEERNKKFDNDSEEKEESNPHCHESCVNYVEECEFPERCKQRRQSNKDCPIKAILGEHFCGFKGEIHLLKYNLINEKRSKDQRLDKMPPFFQEGGMVWCRETRDLHQYIPTETLQVIEANTSYTNTIQLRAITENMERIETYEEKRLRITKAVTKAKEIRKKEEFKEEKRRKKKESKKRNRQIE